MLAVDYTLQILHASDLEAGLNEIADAPRFAAIIDALEDTYSNTLKLSSGDNYIPGPFFNAGGDPSLNGLLGAASVGRADIKIMNDIGFDLSALGNHEFDAGVRELRNIVFPSGAWAGAQFPYLSANLNFTPEPDLNGRLSPGGSEASTIKGRLAPSAVVTKGGAKIGVIGLTTPFLRSISSPGNNIIISPSDPNDLAGLATIVNNQVSLLEGLGVNKIILVSHLQQLQNELDLAPLLDGVDVILAGGSDTRLADATDRLRAGDVVEGDYPLISNDLSGDPIAIVSTDGNYKYVGRLVLGFDSQGVIDLTSLDEAINGAYAADEQGVTDVWTALRPGQDPFGTGTRGLAVRTVTEAVANIINAKDGNLFGKTAVYINGLRSEVRTEETNLGNLSADANLWYSRQVDSSVVLSLKNGGGIRDSIGSTNSDTGERQKTAANPSAGKQAGDISQLDIENSLRFNNGLTLLTVTAQQLKQVAEHSVAAVAPGATPGQFPQIGGFRFSFDATRPAGSRVLSLVVLNSQGQVLDFVIDQGQLQGDVNRTFRLVTLNFLASGGDSYPFPSFSNTNRVDLLNSPSLPSGTAVFAARGSEQDAIAEYLFDAHRTVPYGSADTARQLDTRLQNLAVREDEVIPTAFVLNRTLFARGTDENDVLSLQRRVRSQALFDVRLNGVVAATIDPSTIDLIRVQGLDGNDAISIAGGIPTSALIWGGEGNDYLFGGNASSVLLGGNGDDVIFGGSKQSVLIGGSGQDVIQGGFREDLLIGGNTSYDNSPVDLLAILNYWSGTENYASRVTKLRNGTGVPVLNGSTVSDDGKRDVLFGNNSLDYFFLSLNDISDRGDDEEEN
jgi:2',3'-cyclic-nucleotide 2'-phosphodiesterase (5'-nucleotidase family)